MKCKDRSIDEPSDGSDCEDLLQSSQHSETNLRPVLLWPMHRLFKRVEYRAVRNAEGCTILEGKILMQDIVARAHMTSSPRRAMRSELTSDVNMDGEDEAEEAHGMADEDEVAAARRRRPRNFRNTEGVDKVQDVTGQAVQQHFYNFLERYDCLHSNLG